MSSSRPPRVRRCQAEGCFDAAITAHIFCGRHALSAEGVAFHKEVQMAAAYLNAHEEAPTEEEVARQQKADRFARRVKRGDFTKLLDAATSRILQQAAAAQSYQLELGALRYAIARTITEETDSHRMSLSIARLGNAISRLALAEYATRDPKPVVKYGQEWEPPLPGGEKLVHYIWRHRPADFEERYMAKIDEPESLPWNIDQQVEIDYRASLLEQNTTADGKYLPPPLPEWRRERAERVAGEGLRDVGNPKTENEHPETRDSRPEASAPDESFTEPDFEWRDAFDGLYEDLEAAMKAESAAAAI